VCGAESLHPSLGEFQGRRRRREESRRGGRRAGEQEKLEGKGDEIGGGRLADLGDDCLAGICRKVLHEVCLQSLLLSLPASSFPRLKISRQPLMRLRQR